MINFSTLQGLTIPEGVVTSIESGGVVLWNAVRLQNDRAVLSVEKKTYTTYAGETEYANESFVLLDIYPLSGGTVKVTYGNLTKTIKDTSGAENPNAVEVFFGTFNGVSDSVTTPDSGTLTIEGNFYAYGCGSFSSYANKTNNAHCSCISGVIEIGEFITNIPSHAFNGCTGLTSIPAIKCATIGAYAFNGCTGLTSIPAIKCATIGEYAFYGCIGLTSIPLAEGVVTIDSFAFCLGTQSDMMSSSPMYNGKITIPSTVQSIGVQAFSTSTDSNDSAANDVSERYLREVQVLPTTPPLAEGVYLEMVFGSATSSCKMVVPKGCLTTYKNLYPNDTWNKNMMEES